MISIKVVNKQTKSSSASSSTRRNQQLLRHLSLRTQRMKTKTIIFLTALVALNFHFNAAL